MVLSPESALVLATAAAAATLTGAEENYCSQVEEDKGFYGNDIRWANKTNHWFPATIATCCASCHNQLELVPGGPACMAWTWGYNNNKDCNRQDFKEGEGCCWPKSKAVSNAAGGPFPHPTDSKGQVSGRCSELHSGGIPSESFLNTAWALVIACFAVGVIYLGGGLYLGRKRGLKTHVHVVQLRNIFGLVVDGIAFVSGKSSSKSSTPGTDRLLQPSVSAESSSHAAAATYDASPTRLAARQASRGKPNALHLAASTGDAARIRTILQQSQRESRFESLDAGDERRYTPFAVACSGGHVECVQLLITAGCDTSLACDTDLTGAELAHQLRRSHVTDLLDSLPAANARHGHNDSIIMKEASTKSGERRKKPKTKTGKKVTGVAVASSGKSMEHPETKPSACTGAVVLL